MSKNFRFSTHSPTSQLAGAKVQLLFILARILKSFFLKNIYLPFFSLFLPTFQITLRFLRGAKITSVFKSHKLFRTFFENKFSTSIYSVCSLFYERLLECGCKSSTFFQLYKAYWNLFWKYFLNHWFVGGYNLPFLNFSEFEPVIFENLKDLDNKKTPLEPRLSPIR